VQWRAVAPALAAFEKLKFNDDRRGDEFARLMPSGASGTLICLFFAFESRNERSWRGPVFREFTVVM
jgi:hypothetical protein